MRNFFASVALTAAVAFAGCNPIDAAVDCHSICSRYRSCFDASYDVDACESRCRSKSTTDRDYRMRADGCDACMDDKACVTATFSCGAQCSSVVP